MTKQAQGGYAGLSRGERRMSEAEILPRVGCGVAIVRDGRLLLIRRVREPEAGCWGLPGGKVDPYEPVQDAARREIAEEIGVELIGERLLCVVDLIDRARGEHWVAPVFLAQAFAGEPTILEPEKHSGLDWFALDALPSPLTRAAEVAAQALAAG
jgi:ADP-ribose pyrophosphatase YjhB (NUDIX family)